MGELYLGRFLFRDFLNNRCAIFALTEKQHLWSENVIGIFTNPQGSKVFGLCHLYFI